MAEGKWRPCPTHSSATPSLTWCPGLTCPMRGPHADCLHPKRPSESRASRKQWTRPRGYVELRPGSTRPRPPPRGTPGPNTHRTALVRTILPCSQSPGENGHSKGCFWAPHLAVQSFPAHRSWEHQPRGAGPCPRGLAHELQKSCEASGEEGWPGTPGFVTFPQSQEQRQEKASGTPLPPRARGQPQHSVCV